MSKMLKTGGDASPYSISQNFLTCRAVIERVLRLTSLGPQDLVLEIGAGKGHITRALLARCGRVCAAEIDRKLYEGLKERLGGAQNLTLAQGDFLKMSLPSQPYKVFSNIPFSRTTEIVRRLTQAPNPPTECWLIMEKGAAKRFCGKPAETQASLLLRPFFRAEIPYYFRREDFHPAPSVDVVLLHLSLRREPELPLSEREAFCTFLRLAAQRGVCGHGGPLSKKQVSTALRLAGLPQPERSGNMLYVQWLCLFRCWRRFGGRKR